MTGQCCKRAAAGSILPAALWVVLPKCPLCLAAWLAAAAGAAWVHGLALLFTLVFGVAAVALSVRSHANGRNRVDDRGAASRNVAR
jgi:hypothetical protein